MNIDKTKQNCPVMLIYTEILTIGDKITSGGDKSPGCLPPPGEGVGWEEREQGELGGLGGGGGRQQVNCTYLYL